MAVRVLESRIVSSSGQYPTRIVLQRQGNESDSHSFSTHIEVMPPDREHYLILGHYDLRIDDAVEDFYTRLQNLVKGAYGP